MRLSEEGMITTPKTYELLNFKQEGNLFDY